MRLVRAELQKLFTTRLWWVMMLSMLAYAGLSLGVFIAFAGQAGQGGGPALPSRDSLDFQRVIWGSGLSGAIFPMILGIVMMTSEYRYQTITTTFLTTPRRERVVAAKLGAGVLVGLLFGIAVMLLTALAVIPAVQLSGGSFAFTDPYVLRATGAVPAALALYTLFGIGLGALIRNQIGAILAAVGWVFIVEALLTAIPPLQPVGKWTPGGAANSLLATIDVGFGASRLLPAWAGALVLAGYALVFAAVASMTTIRRDVT
ncbi:ABC transporter permease [Nonomuraea sp. NPDC050556]|uniref:ABC transporter permease n=1 Tax=Nonomuraea sp. NPDC050556 TaxID=3364369 RepID=UPI0037A3C208